MASNDPKRIPQLSQKEVCKFWSKVDKTPGFGPEGECWKWAGYSPNPNKPGQAYGRTQVSSRPYPAHRVSYFLVTGEDPFPNLVLHICNVPQCVRPSHLELGNTQQNVNYRVLCGRTATGERNGMYTHPEKRPVGIRNGRYTKPKSILRGESVSTSKLTETDIREILLRYTGEYGGAVKLAAEFGVSSTLIGYIASGKAWAHVQPEKKRAILNKKYSTQLTEEDVQDIILLHKSGKPLKFIAELFDVSITAIWKRVKDSY